jgi:hypothetical protein
MQLLFDIEFRAVILAAVYLDWAGFSIPQRSVQAGIFAPLIAS